MRPKLVLIFLLLAFGLSGSAEQAKPPADAWAAFQFLDGKWAANGGGDPGQGAGELSFHFDLDRHLLVRKNHVDYPAANGRPAFSHDDLLITYIEPSSKAIRADYWDNEGHAIHYSATVSEDGKTIQYVSLPEANQPAFRISYIKSLPDLIKVRFEIASPGKPAEFKVYVDGTAKRVSAAGMPSRPN